MDYKLKKYDEKQLKKVQAVIIVRIERKKYLGLVKKHRMRTKIAQELFDTEKTFVIDLHL